MKKQAEWSRAYNAKSYDRLYPFVPKGRKAEIQAVADEQGETLNEFIVKAIDERMKRLQKPTPFSAPQGEACPKDCKRRGSKVSGPQAASYDPEDGVPWCFEYATELAWLDEKAGTCQKCDRCKNREYEQPKK